jgi:hypothetical protein
VTRVGLLRVDRHFPIQIYVSDAQYTCRDLPSGTLPVVEEGRPYFAARTGAHDYCGISAGSEQYNRACAKHFNRAEWILKKHMETAETEETETANDPEQE